MKHYLLSFMSLFLFGILSAQDCSNLFFSEYVEGSGNNKALEIYNPTNGPIDLSNYVIKRYSNGSPFPTEELSLTGTIQPKDVVVVTNGQTDSVWVSSGGYWSLPIDNELYELGDLHCSGEYPTPMYFNGDDAMTLETNTGQFVDIFAKYGDDPGSNGWNDIPPTYTAGDQWWTSWTKDNTLIRKPGVKNGVITNPDLFKVHIEWDSIPKNTFDSLGFHRCDCESMGIDDKIYSHSIVIYPNPVSGNTVIVNASFNIIKVDLFNLLGQVILSIQCETSNRKLSFEVPNVKKGIYMIKVHFSDNSSTLHRIVFK